MIAGKFIGWVLDKVPDAFKFIGKKVRQNEVQNIDDAVNSGNDVYIANKLQSIKNKYQADAKANS